MKTCKLNLKSTVAPKYVILAKLEVSQKKNNRFVLMGSTYPQGDAEGEHWSEVDDTA